ncbi:universal stress protein [Pseudomonas putida]|uniref:universal stress protein n=1 Tax=Pseudomonas putida TaxID=303 RepID=UPI00275CB64F|nr:universal stress protein [Pseudomonas putida]MDP9523188.1 universal stress protein [Pseudomonas putida]
MSQYRQLLVLLTDIDPHSPALRRALALAHASGAAVHILGLFEPRAEHVLREARLNEAEAQRQFERYREQLEGLAARHRASGTCLTLDTVNAEDLRDQAADYMRELKPDMVIKDIEATPALARFFGTPVDCALMRACEGMMHFVPPAAASLPKRILVAVDTASGDDPCAQTLFNRGLIRAAQALALQCDAQLHLLSAYDLVGVYAADMVVAQTWLEEMRDALRVPFDALADAQGVPDDCRHFKEGGAVQVIRDQVAALDIDIVVMGVVQPKGLAKLLGDTTERIVSDPPCSVLAVHPGVMDTWEPTPCN